MIRPIDTQQASLEWKRAVPFPHLVIENFLDEPGVVCAAFPSMDWNEWKSLGDSYQLNKFSCSAIGVIPPEIREVIHKLNEPGFLSVLEAISGINGLIPDPYLEGGGLHLSKAGGILSHHSDFHIYGRLNLYRRLNLIVYLNKEWQVEDGGELELLLPGDSSPTARIEPILNRAVLFETNDSSIHGFTRPVGVSAERRSIALYYYTSSETAGFSGDQTTHWRSHPRVSLANRPRFLVYKVLLKISRIFSIAAQIVNPNQGISLLRSRLRTKK